MLEDKISWQLAMYKKCKAKFEENINVYLNMSVNIKLI